MIDTHCHLDQYPDPASVATAAAGVGVSIIAVTSLPSHFVAGQEPVKLVPRTRLALGLHPLLAAHHEAELGLFERLLGETSYVGEIGLDFSKHGRATRDQQLKSFRFVLSLLRTHPRFVTLHSRGAEQVVFDLLGDFGVGPVVFHWYSGPIALAAPIAASGHFFSFNAAMLASSRGRELLNVLPRGAVLTETDGPFMSVGGRPARPQDVVGVCSSIAECWGVAPAESNAQLAKNFRAAIAHVRGQGSFEQDQLLRPK